jgi:hypothetical protein
MKTITTFMNIHEQLIKNVETSQVWNGAGLVHWQEYIKSLLHIMAKRVHLNNN